MAICFSNTSRCALTNLMALPRGTFSSCLFKVENETLSAKSLPRGSINTEKAPAAIGTYSQAIKAGDTVYLSGQIPLNPATMQLVEGGFEAQTVQVFENLKSVAEAAGGGLKDIVKLNIYLTDLANFAKVNEVMGRYFAEPYPARAAIGINALPKDSLVEMDAVLVLG